MCNISGCFSLGYQNLLATVMGWERVMWGIGCGEGEGEAIALLWLNFTHDRTARVGCLCVYVCVRAWEGNWNWNWIRVWESRFEYALQFDLHLSSSRKVFAIQLKRDYPNPSTPAHLPPIRSLYVCLSPWQASTRRVTGDVSIIGVAYAHNGSTNTRALVVWWWWWWGKAGVVSERRVMRGGARWLGRDIKFSLSWAQIKARSINKQHAAHFMPQRGGWERWRGVLDSPQVSPPLPTLASPCCHLVFPVRLCFDSIYAVYTANLLIIVTHRATHPK